MNDLHQKLMCELGSQRLYFQFRFGLVARFNAGIILHSAINL